MSGGGILAQYEAANAAVVVPMGNVQFNSFHHQKPAIGTRDLDSCSVVIIASTFGALLAHIPPRPEGPSTDPYAGDRNARNIMTHVVSLYNHYKNQGYFPPAATVVLCAKFNGYVALPDQQAIMLEALRDQGLQPLAHTYDVPTDRTQPGQGTVILISQANQTPLLYVEDRAVTLV